MVPGASGITQSNWVGNSLKIPNHGGAVRFSTGGSSIYIYMLSFRGAIDQSSPAPTMQTVVLYRQRDRVCLLEVSRPKSNSTMQLRKDTFAQLHHTSVFPVDFLLNLFHLGTETLRSQQF